MNLEELTGWAPIGLSWHEDEPRFEWVRLDAERFHEPFFDDTIARLLRRPFNLLFARSTGPDVLAELLARSPGLRPAGLVFHGSRSGSTLVAQMLAAVRRSIVLSEAAPVDAILRSRHRSSAVAEEARIAWLRGLLGALGRSRDPDEDRLFVKLDSWSILDLPTVSAAFPGVPWIFLYRDPLEVLASHMRQRGVQMVPGLIEPVALGLDAGEVAAWSHEEYCARLLARLYDAAAANAEAGAGRLVNYSQLPGALLSSPDALFGLSWSEAERAAMHGSAGRDAKSRGREFRPDGAAKRAEASPALRAACEQWAEPAYQRLETLRARR